MSCNTSAKTSAGHLIGSTVEVKPNKSNNSEISVRLDQDIDETSQSSSSLEDKFTLKEEKTDEARSSSGKVFLKMKTVESKPKKTIIRLPQISTCRIGRDRNSLLVLPQWELKVLCRRGWRHQVSGFHHMAKSNPTVWPYQCPRPIFRHTWLYRTATMTCLTAVALQLRIFWSCLRWDDMQEKGASDGKKQITTDTEIVQTEILKRKYSGRFNEKTEYLRRKVTIPFEVPKPVREFTPSQRSGLRKRRRAQSPEDKRPESVEEWVPEEQLQLWEIRLCGEKIERAANQPKKLESSGIGQNPVKITMSASGSSVELKQRLEEQLKQQRVAFQQQQQQQRDGRTVLKISGIASKPGLVNPVQTIATVATTNPAKKFMKTKDGRLISVQTLGSLQTSSSVGNTTIYPMTGSLPKVQIAPHSGSKVIRLQTVPANPRMILPRGPRPLIQTSNVTTLSQGPIRLGGPGGISIVRLPDGQMQVKGLQEGQHMIQRPDGKLQIVNSPNVMNKTIPTVSGNAIQVTQQKTNIIKPIQQPQIVKVNGQQVLMRKDGINSHIVSVGAGDAIKSGVLSINNQQVQQHGSPTLVVVNNNSVASPQVKTLVASDGTMVKTVVGNVVSGGMPNAVAPTQTVAVNNQVVKSEGSSSLTLRVQVRMTEQGPKTIIQGLQPSVGLTKDHIRAIQQQVRSMLAQYNLKVNQLSPIMTLTLHINNQAQPQQQQVNLPINNVQTQPQQQQIIKQISASPSKISLKLPAVVAIKNNNNSPVGLASGGTTFIHTSNSTVIPVVNNSASPRVMGEVINTMTGKDPSKVMVGGATQPQQFELTDDYIQQTIQSTLSRNDLSPDVEEKLIQYKKYSTEHSVKGALIVPLNNNKRQRDMSESSEGRSKVGGGSHKRVRTASTSAESPGRLAISSGATPATPAKKSRRSGGGSTPADETKRRQSLLAKLDSQLSKHKELLKKDILKKRAYLEKELQMQIHKELGMPKFQMAAAMEKKTTIAKVDPPITHKKKKRQDHDSSATNRVPAPASNVTVSTTPTTKLTVNSSNKKQISHTAKSISTNKKTKTKSKKIVCICRTPFDDSKFYVGCDLCANWFHGDCVGITEASSRAMTEYVCDDCANAKLNKELYCFCKKPYDESQFYICCEQCDDWYHGRCVGILQGEADDIDDYICPKCDPNNVYNQANQKKLSNKDYTELKKLAKSLVGHKNAWPFLDAVDPSEVPDYYKVVSQPMDLRTVEKRVKDHHYSRLAGFIGDVMLLLDNCRLYNPSNSSFVSCAATLESFFCSKIKLIKQKIS